MRFEEETKAYQAFGTLKQSDADGRIRLLKAATVKRGEDGVVWAKEGAATGATRCDRAFLLGLIARG